METLYKILKILVAVLLIAVVAVGISRLLPDKEPPAQAPETAQAPVQVPDFTVYDDSGTAYRLSDFLGKPIVLNFWASWCGPCKAEMPDIEACYQTYGDEIHFLIVNLTDGQSETLETASGFIAEQGYTFPVYYDTTMEAAYAYAISAIPATFFIDAQGNLVSQVVSMMDAETLQENIDLLLS